MKDMKLIISAKVKDYQYSLLGHDMTEKIIMDFNMQLGIIIGLSTGSQLRANS